MILSVFTANCLGDIYTHLLGAFMCGCAYTIRTSKAFRGVVSHFSVVLFLFYLHAPDFLNYICGFISLIVNRIGFCVSSAMIGFLRAIYSLNNTDLGLTNFKQFKDMT